MRAWLLLIPFLGTVALADYSLFNAGNREGWRGKERIEKKDVYNDDIQPLLAKRCVACHGCFEARCQLNLETYEGFRRGMHPESIYGNRLPATKPTRMIDAKSLDEWRNDKKFLPVVAHDSEKNDDEKKARWQDSVAYQLLTHNYENNKAGFALKDLEKLDEEVTDDGRRSCIVTSAQFSRHFSSENPHHVISFDQYRKKSDFGGMPYGLPRLEKSQYETLTSWMKNGAIGPENQATLEKSSNPAVVQALEKFFNGESAQAQISARYLFEHLFTASIYFDDIPNEYYRLVRARAKDGVIDEIVTELPYAPPPRGVTRPYYRLKKITGSIVQKTLIVWRVNTAKIRQLESLFHADWKQGEIRVPPYNLARHNPFETFAQIPALVRARFMIQNSSTIIGGMVQGAVCVGSRATYAISDHFWVRFLKPESDPSVQTPKLGMPNYDKFATAPQAWEPQTDVGKAFFKGIERFDGIFRLAERVGGARRAFHAFVGEVLDLGEAVPKGVAAEWLRGVHEGATDLVVELRKKGATLVDIVNAVHHYVASARANYEYQVAFEKTLRGLKKEGLTVADLWTGDGDSTYPDGNNPNRWLTVTRHGLSSTVQFGDEGGAPQSIWALSYSNFERLYYNLVADFKQWGSLPHKLATWRHMSYVRLEGEDLAISFLPIRARRGVREQFARGIGAAKNYFFFPLHSTVEYGDLPPRPAPNGTVTSLINDMRVALEKHPVAVPKDLQPTKAQTEWEGPLYEVQHKSEIDDGVHYSSLFPDITYLKVHVGEREDWYYTILGDRAYKAHNMVFLEDLNRDDDHDTLAIYRGFVGAHPGVFLEIDKDDLTDFVGDLKKLSTVRDWARFVREHGIGRNSVHFWRFFDNAHFWKAKRGPGNNPVEQGIFDLNQYGLHEGKS